MWDLPLPTWIIGLSSFIGAVTAIIAAILGLSKKARAGFKKLVRKNTDADMMKRELDEIKALVTGFIETNEKTNANEREALQSILRHNITDIYYKHLLTDKKLLAYEKEDVATMYAAYEKIGGNCYVHDIVKEMKRWDVNV